MNRLTTAIAACAAFGVLGQPAVAQDQSWYDRVDLIGDFRVRYDNVDEEFVPRRDVARLRMRLGLATTVSEDVKVVLQIATGGDNPTSTNQSFEDGFSRKDIGLDLAYVDWAVTDSLNVNLGKMKNPLFKAGKVPLVWDSDLNPEGIAAKYNAGRLFATAAVFSIEERRSSDDSLLFALQGGIKLPIGGRSKLTAGLGYFSYTSTIGNPPFYNGNPRGNSVDSGGNYIYDYKDAEVFAQFDTDAAGWPLSIFAHYVQNSEVSVQDTGYAVGAKLGSAKKDGDMEFSWVYQDIEADALIGTFSDSDFGGGGTDSSGHMLRAKYALNDKIHLGGTLFVNQIDRFQGVEHGYNRLQLDIEYSFD